MTPKPNTATIAGVVQTILAAIGIPLVACLLGAKWQSLGEYAKQHPWQVLWLLVLYEIAVFIRSLVTDVWKRVRGDLVSFFADRLKVAAQARFSGFEKDYRQHVDYHCRDFDVKGLTIQGVHALEMERVFVELSLVPDRPDKGAHDPVPPQSQAEAVAERHHIREYLEGSGHFAIIGAPGSGKTTLLRHLAITLAWTRLKKVRQSLPVLLYFRSHAKAISENKDISLQEVILASEILKEQTVKPPQNWFEDKLKDGKCLLLLDGLDEVGDPDIRTKIVAWVERCLHTYANNRFFITSRPLGYMENPVPGVTTLRVLPFTQDEVDRFVSKWYLANEVMSHNQEDEGVRIQARTGAGDLISRIRGSDLLRDLAVNPLLLTMIATVHRFGGEELPRRRAKLYREIFEVFLGKRQAARGIQDDFRSDQKRFVLESLGYELMCRGERDISASDAAAAIEASLKSVDPTARPEAFLQMIESSSGLLLEREPGIYSFAHKTFQEYLAAAHIRSHKLEQDLASRIEAGGWEGTILLYVAEADATPILEACLRHTPPSMPMLTLALECIQEAQRVDQNWREKIGNLAEDADPEHQRIYGEALLAIRSKRMVSISKDDAVDATFVTNAEYQVFLDEMRQQGIDYRPDHWTYPRFLKGEGARPVAILRYSHVERFCQWMTAKYGGTSEEYTAPSTKQLQAVPLSDSKQQQAQDRTGCWSDERRIVGGDDHVGKLRLVAERSLQLVIVALEASYRARAISLVGDLVRARDLARDLARDPDVDVGRARDLALELARALDLGRALARDYDLALDLPLALDPYRDRFRHLDPTQRRAQELDLNLSRAHELATNLASDANLASNRARDLARDLNRQSELASGLASGLGCDLVASREIAIGIALDRARDLASSLDRDLDLASSPSFAYDLAQRTSSDLLFLERPSVAVQTALLNEVRKGAVVGGIRLARIRASASPLRRWRDKVGGSTTVTRRRGIRRG
jgi:hypothetical protein